MFQLRGYKNDKENRNLSNKDILAHKYQFIRNGEMHKDLHSFHMYTSTKSKLSKLRDEFTGALIFHNTRD